MAMMMIDDQINKYIYINILIYNIKHVAIEIQGVFFLHCPALSRYQERSLCKSSSLYSCPKFSILMWIFLSEMQQTVMEINFVFLQ